MSRQENTTFDEFAEIRPYEDCEVETVLRRLMMDEEFIQIIARLKFPRASKLMPSVSNFILRGVLGKRLKSIRDVGSFQRIISEYVEDTIEKTISRFTASGLDSLPRDGAFLYVSNHRDIVLDPALTNYALFRDGRETARIAIGDNLLTKPFVSDLMRLNKSFIVKRSVTGAKQMMRAYNQLSSYIHHSLSSDRSVWIAQREGRAKDGMDRTEPAIIRMLYMSRKRLKEDFSDVINRLRIVPVSISYEYDPCDLLKAIELYDRASTENYEKDSEADLTSIRIGIVSPKGRVHVSFGEPLEGTFQDPAQVAEALDRSITDRYKLHPSNAIAFGELLESGNRPIAWADEDWERISKLAALDRESLARKTGLDAGNKRKEFSERLAAYPEKYRSQLLEMYANPVISAYWNLCGASYP